MDYKPANVPDLSVYLTVKDADASIKFYQDAFGFKLGEKKDDGNGNIHVEMSKNGALLMFSQVGSFGSKKQTPKDLGIDIPSTLYVYTEDTDKLYKIAMGLGAKSVMEPHDSFWGDRFCSIVDHDGYEWGFGTQLSKK